MCARCVELSRRGKRATSRVCDVSATCTAWMARKGPRHAVCGMGRAGGDSLCTRSPCPQSKGGGPNDAAVARHEGSPTTDQRWATAGRRARRRR
eukprot:7378441-Prymnesium_polylepis.2